MRDLENKANKENEKNRKKLSNLFNVFVIYLFLILIILVIACDVVNAQCYIAGYVYDSDSGEPADGKNVTAYNTSVGVSDHVNGTIGDFGANLYLLDCLSGGTTSVCDTVGYNWTVEVIDTGNGWFAGPVTVLITGSCADMVPDMTLNDKPNLTIHQPENNSLLIGLQEINVSSEDISGGVDTVRFMIENSTGNYSGLGVLGGWTELIQVDATIYYNITLNTSKFADGNYTLWVISNDTLHDSTTMNGNITKWINIEINNTLPDLYINSSEINVSDMTPSEGDNVTINVTVENRGDGGASNILVRYYNETKGERSMIGNQTIDSILDGENQTIAFNWTAFVGKHNITIELDYAYEGSGGNITEITETNNIANVTLLIYIYVTYVGNLTGYYVLSDNNNQTLYQWEITDTTGSNILVTDKDSEINFAQLHPLGKDIDNISQPDDFYELDAFLNLDKYDDNITAVWTDEGVPKKNATFDIYDNDIFNISVVNSTNTTSFLTGILWDKSDGGNEYDTTHDIVFVSQINNSQYGFYGDGGF